MPPRLTPDQIVQVSGLVARSIATQRERYHIVSSLISPTASMVKSRHDEDVGANTLRQRRRNYFPSLKNMADISFRLLSKIS